MKKSILFLSLLLPVLSYAHPITVTNSGYSKGLVILPVSPRVNNGFGSLQINTMTSCLESAEGLSVLGQATTIPPQTTIIYNFDIPSNFLDVCTHIYDIVANTSGNGCLIVTNTYNVGLTKTEATQKPAFTFTLTYYADYFLTPPTYVQISSISQPVPSYITSYGHTYTELTVNADEMQ